MTIKVRDRVPFSIHFNLRERHCGMVHLSLSSGEYFAYKTEVSVLKAGLVTKGLDYVILQVETVM